MIKFGPSGFCNMFLEDHAHSEQIPAFLKHNGLDAYEYAFNRGVNISDEKAVKLRKIFDEYNIQLSVHGPYYINLANPDDEMAEKSKGYIISSLKKMKLLGSKYLVYHPGSLMKQTREQAFQLVMKRTQELIKLLDENDIHDMYICPETMGKHGQVGTVEEIAQMCALDNRIIPTLDFGHINSFGLGSLNTEDDFDNVFKTLEKFMGERYKKVHIHFSRIEYGAKGEIKHLNFDEDEKFGPDFELLARVLKKRGIEATIICESRGDQTKDSIKMKQIFNQTIWFD